MKRDKQEDYDKLVRALSEEPPFICAFLRKSFGHNYYLVQASLTDFRAFSDFSILSKKDLILK